MLYFRLSRCYISISSFSSLLTGAISFFFSIYFNHCMQLQTPKSDWNRLSVFLTLCDLNICPTSCLLHNNDSGSSNHRKYPPPCSYFLSRLMTRLLASWTDRDGLAPEKMVHRSGRLCFAIFKFQRNFRVLECLKKN